MVSTKFWLPFITWILGVALVTYIIFASYTPSPTIIVTYFAMVLAGFYILWKGKELQNNISRKLKRKLKRKKENNEKTVSVRRKRK